MVEKHFGYEWKVDPISHDLVDHILKFEHADIGSFFITQDALDKITDIEEQKILSLIY